MSEDIDRDAVEAQIRTAMPVPVHKIVWRYEADACTIVLDVRNPMGQPLAGVCWFEGPASVPARLESFAATVRNMLADCADCPNCSGHAKTDDSAADLR